jgi:hypothetical protein
VTPEETTAPAFDRELSPAGSAAMAAAIDAIEREDTIAGMATAAFSLLLGDDEPNAHAVLAELTAVEVDRVAQAAVKLAAIAAPTAPVDDPAGLAALVVEYGDARANAEVGAEHAGQTEVDAYAAQAAELLDRIRAVAGSDIVEAAIEYVTVPDGTEECADAWFALRDAVNNRLNDRAATNA